ncbi:MAG: hypothetical protein A2039_02675 [Candidatus Melainabacteria bacterium GWA2_34_9]|nr:MAG: hypothetical protein A2039_02675 [Candidatus Melainabacteria bacterium GWA2_34_9]
MGFSTSVINIKNEPVTISQNRDGIRSSLNEDKIKLFNASNTSNKQDLSNNKKFDLSEAGRNFLAGMKKPFNEVIKYAKAHPIQAIVMGGACVGLTALSLAFPVVGYGLTALGCYFIANPLIKEVNKVTNAKNGDDKEKAFADFGESASYVALTFGTNALGKVIPHSETSKATKVIHKGGKHLINMWSNATDVASYGPRTSDIGFIGSNFLNLTRKILRAGETSYETNK